MAKNRPLGVKGHCKIFRLFLPQESTQDRGKTIDSMGGQPAVIAQGFDSMVGPIDIGTAINKIDFFLFGRSKKQLFLLAHKGKPGINISFKV